jgi:hypothetical protein
MENISLAVIRFYVLKCQNIIDLAYVTSWIVAPHTLHTSINYQKTIKYHSIISQPANKYNKSIPKYIPYITIWKLQIC